MLLKSVESVMNNNTVIQKGREGSGATHRHKLRPNDESLRLCFEHEPHADKAEDWGPWCPYLAEKTPFS